MKETLKLILDKVQEGIEQVEGGDLWQAVTELKDAQYWIGILKKEMEEVRNEQQKK